MFGIILPCAMIAEDRFWRSECASPSIHLKLPFQLFDKNLWRLSISREIIPLGLSAKIGQALPNDGDFRELVFQLCV
jgi:hypothetical protein